MKDANTTFVKIINTKDEAKLLFRNISLGDEASGQKFKVGSGLALLLPL